MNVERINKVADVIQANPEHFHMGSVVNLFDLFKPGHLVDVASADLTTCGTTACIAGWACNLWAAEIEQGDDWESAGARILGLDRFVTDRLFYNYGLDTADKAADHLRRMALDYEGRAS